MMITNDIKPMFVYNNRREMIKFGIQCVNSKWDNLDDFAATHGGIDWDDSSDDNFIIHCCSAFANIFGILQSAKLGVPVLMPELKDMVAEIVRCENGDDFEFTNFPTSEYVLWDIVDFKYTENTDTCELEMQKVKYSG